MQQMGPQMAYDRAITVFSPDGRLFQVEYAREAVKRGTTAIGVKCKEGAVLAVDKRVVSRLLEVSSVEKLFQIDDHVGAATSGLVADARSLIDKARVDAQVNRLRYDETIGVEPLAKSICDYKQAFTQYGGLRPFGTALIIAGVDDGDVRLFETDPSGALLEYKATGIGSGRSAVMEIFEEQYDENIDLEGGILLSLEALYKATEGKFDTPTVEVGVVELKTKRFRRLEVSELEGYVNTIKERHASEENKE
ncbi:MAG: archaeal proteasome endopeptidase complex subunit alpha [Halobacteriota archaeon]|nr:archaeal proteasome endopeptidase complex subunit alpha [Halobacteriota archaeon]